jgi:hypothetical protein
VLRDELLEECEDLHWATVSIAGTDGLNNPTDGNQPVTNAAASPARTRPMVFTRPLARNTFAVPPHALSRNGVHMECEEIAR